MNTVNVGFSIPNYPTGTVTARLWEPIISDGEIVAPKDISVTAVAGVGTLVLPIADDGAARYGFTLPVEDGRKLHRFSADVDATTTDLTPLLSVTLGEYEVDALVTEAVIRAAADTALDTRVDALELAPPAHTQVWSTITATPTTLAGYGISDAQPLDADLSAIAALSTTAYGRALLALADAAAGRTAFGLGTAATFASSAFALARHVTAQTLTDAASITWDTSAGHIASVTLGGNRTLAAPTNGVAGTYVLRVTQDGTGGRTLAYNAAFKWAGGIAPTLSTAIGAVDVLTFASYDGSTFYGSILKAFA